MKKVAHLLNAMLEIGIIDDYAVFGAVAQMRYTEAVATMDADILIVIPDNQRLDILSPIYTFCKEQGYEPEGEAIQVGDWPVQFIPTFDELTKEAVAKAETAEMDGIPIRVVGADHLAAIALDAGRAKDFARILALLEANAVTHRSVEQLAGKHGLTEKWKTFRKRFDEA